MSGPLKQLGDPDALVCEGGVCLIPGATGDSYSGSVMSATTASNADTSASASTKTL